MAGRYPRCNDDGFLVYVFQIQSPAPTSTDKVRCVQNAYLVHCGQSELNGVDGSDFPTIHRS